MIFLLALQKSDQNYWLSTSIQQPSIAHTDPSRSYKNFNNLFKVGEGGLDLTSSSDSLDYNFKGILHM